MRVIILSAFVLLVCCYSAEGWFSGGSSGSSFGSSSSRYNSPSFSRSSFSSFNSPSTYRSSSSLFGSGTGATFSRRIGSSSTTFDAGVGFSKYGNPSASLGLTHKGNGWSGSIKGSLDTKGNAGLTLGLNFRKRSVEWNGNHYNITLQADPCNFYTYDDNRDGVIIKGELHAIFGNNEMTDALFADFDATTDDGVVDEEEFYAMAPVTITACADTDEE